MRGFLTFKDSDRIVIECLNVYYDKLNNHEIMILPSIPFILDTIIWLKINPFTKWEGQKAARIKTVARRLQSVIR